MLNVDPDVVAQPVTVGEEKGLSRYSFKVPLSAIDEMYEEREQTPVNVIKDQAKGDINPVNLSKETLDLEDDEIEEEKSNLSKRKLSKLSRMTVAELQQKVNVKASSTCRPPPKKNNTLMYDIAHRRKNNPHSGWALIIHNVSLLLNFLVVNVVYAYVLTLIFI
ncbi:hypothetical protein TNIN_89881 [Trichonephila inaurata madagascariensis]|uniref:Uncharacterized protein n=1 Tax=Trichonephila inaurata madagascariensis TaxID=2747483 RepID=A0A8X6XP72_9ARAC|nr:hypothetical protein TNIN_89881 [Trichonephila inaurata madagascariensis]